MGSIKIKSDGTPQGTRIYTHNNKAVQGVTSISIDKIETKGLVTATLTFEGVELDLTAEVKGKLYNEKAEEEHY